MEGNPRAINLAIPHRFCIARIVNDFNGLRMLLTLWLEYVMMQSFNRSLTICDRLGGSHLAAYMIEHSSMVQTRSI